jgi:hypothetical protein
VRPDGDALYVVSCSAKPLSRQKQGDFTFFDPLNEMNQGRR